MRAVFYFSGWRYALLPVLALMLSACDGKTETGAATKPDNAAIEGWPRQIQTLDGTLTLKAPPQRIVSTSVTVTGTLLAIDAPVIASSATSPGSRVSDSQGFLRQWGDVALERKVKKTYETKPNAEAIANEAPDLIVVAATGGDSALALRQQLSAIAPVLVVNYDDKSWQELASQLGYATGREEQARAVIAKFDDRLNAVKQRLQLPPQPVSAFVWREDGKGANLWTIDSAQGQLLKQLGFELAAVPDAVRGNHSMGMRKDLVQLSGEKMADGLNGNTYLLFSTDEESIEPLLANPFVAHLPAVRDRQVYAMGNDTFRLDYYSASNMLDRLEKYFGTH
ncbi:MULTISPECIES: Fe2+-enterobactin ABC transporter substrate-binding protein [unclassified Brenneria]|uniref:Fe2+-enterobactin ABC transporter substrate-binding protein n=1 Tax=unclassified Brenneria TaxID=2634434 RepID=UPI0015523F71|nr:Fe2+-enterobactin ABC transporter substrate-binding protein [Brenneria sp. hezel4-2-4]MEE3651298.1 Fe2+-enterobactin ABC transporter substrate-binding protein [Brenneria sp. HEZEL_4_2_4]NPD01253.1 Fe2+-enterobactin ABC transporter substrate-binding protein [Brenneria sp. hezel4-2-4]